jgi:hypothetical protein
MIHTFLSVILASSLVAALGGCATKRFSFDTRPQENIHDLQATLKTSSLKSCETVNTNIRLTAPVQKAEIFWNENKPILIYEAAFKDAVKTVWQPLNKKFEQDGQGVVIGQRGMPYVGEFSAHSDALGGFWTSYRFKIPNTEMHAVAVEYLEKSASAKIVRLAMPQSRDYSAQRSWIIPLPQPKTDPKQQQQQLGLAHVIVKTVSTIPGSIEKSEALYTWYLLHAGRGIVKKMGEFRPSVPIVNIEQFVLSRDINDPIGIGLASAQSSSRNNFGEKSDTISSVVAIRPFTPGAPTHVLHEDNRPLSSLAVSKTDVFLNSAIVAWVRDPIDTTHPSIEWTSSKFKIPGSPTTQGLSPYKKGRNLIRDKEIRRISVNYFPSQLDFVQFPNSENMASTALTWWGGNDSERALIVSQLPPTSKAAPGSLPETPRTIAVLSRDIIGTPLAATFSTTENNAVVLTFTNTSRDQNTDTASEIRFCSVEKSTLAE